MNTNDKICSLLWNQLSVSSLGSLRLCCNSYDGQIKHEGKAVFPYNFTDTEYMKTLPALNSIRDQMLAGKEPSVCSRCWDMEKTGAQSFRNIHNQIFPETHQSVLAGNTTFKLEYLSLDFGNKCNLACKMCSPGSSSFLAKEQAGADGFLSKDEVGLANRMLEKANEKQWYEHENFWTSIQPHLKNLTRLFIIGGEPFIIPEHTKLLELIVEYGNPQNVKICYNSNLTTVPNKLLELWKNFKVVEISASIDGTDEFYEYIRWPTPFKKIEENINQVLALNMPNLFLGIHCTVQNLNVANLPTLIKRFNKLGIFFIPVHKPNYLHASVLPAHVISKALDEIKDIYKTVELNPSTHFNIQSLIANLEDVLKIQQEQPELREKFFKAMQWYDQRRKQNLLDVHPYFKEWML